MDTTTTSQLLIATWRASRLATDLSPPVVATNSGAELSGLMMGSSVSGTSTRAFTNGTVHSMRTPGLALKQ